MLKRRLLLGLLLAPALALGQSTTSVKLLRDGTALPAANVLAGNCTSGAAAPTFCTAGQAKTSLALTSGDVGLGSVTNDAQTKAAVVPNTAPAAGRVLVGNAGGTAYAPVAVSGDGTLTSAGALAVTKTGGVTFGTLATQSGTFSGTSSGTNTGDVTLGTFGATPNSNGLTLAGQSLVGQPADGTNPGFLTAGAQTIGGVKTFSSAPVLSGASITSATIPNAALATNPTNASNLSSGTVAAARGGAGTITGALRGNGSGVVTQAACADLSNAAASCSTDATNATNIASGTLANARLPSAISVTNLDGILGANTAAAATVTNLTLSGTGRIIAADFTNATLPSRAYFQTSTANSTTNVGALPSGSGTAADFIAFNNSTPTNAGFVWMAAASAAMSVNSAAAGSGTVLPLSLQTNSIDRIIIRPSSSTAQTTAGQGIQFPTATWTDSSSNTTVALTAVIGVAAQTLAASSATTYTRAATLYLVGPPLAGTNVTLTNTRALLVTGASNELSSTSSGALTIPLYISNASTTTDTAASIRFSLSTTVGANSAEIRGHRTNRAVAGDSDLVFITMSNSAANERLRIRDDGLTTLTGQLVITAGAAGAGKAPLKLTSGTNLTTAEAGAFEYNGTNLFFTRTGTTREGVLVGNRGASAPSTSALTAFTSYYGTGGTIALSAPTTWFSVVGDDGVAYKVPAY